MVLHVVKTATDAAGVYANTPCMILEDATRPGLQLVGNENNIGIIQFGDRDSSNPGEIYYDHSVDQFNFRTAGSVNAIIDSTGGISGSSTLDIVGAVTFENVLNVTGAITTAAGVTASAGVSSSYGFYNNLSVNQGGTNNVTVSGDGTVTATGIISGAIGITGSSFRVNDTILLNANGNITNVSAVSAVGLTSSAGVSSSYGFYNNLSVNQGGTKSIQLQGNGRIVVGGGGRLILGGGIAGATTLSSSGDANIVGKTYIENTLNVTGAAVFASTVSSAVGITGSSLTINDTIELNANGKITKAHSISGSNDVTFLNIYANQGGTNSVLITGDGIVNASQRVTSALGITGSSMLVNGKIHLNANANIGGVSSFSASLGVTGSSFKVNDTIHLNANGNITNVHHIYPAADNTYDLGAPDFRWRNIYTGDLHLKNDRGDWTVIEESDYLSLTNNKTGHRYKILMERID